MGHFVFVYIRCKTVRLYFCIMASLNIKYLTEEQLKTFNDLKESPKRTNAELLGFLLDNLVKPSVNVEELTDKINVLEAKTQTQQTVILAKTKEIEILEEQIQATKEVFGREVEGYQNEKEGLSQSLSQLQENVKALTLPKGVFIYTPSDAAAMYLRRLLAYFRKYDMQEKSLTPDQLIDKAIEKLVSSNYSEIKK